MCCELVCGNPLFGSDLHGNVTGLGMGMRKAVANSRGAPVVTFPDVILGNPRERPSTVQALVKARKTGPSATWVEGGRLSGLEDPSWCLLPSSSRRLVTRGGRGLVSLGVVLLEGLVGGFADAFHEEQEGHQEPEQEVHPSRCLKAEKRKKSWRRLEETLQLNHSN